MCVFLLVVSVATVISAATVIPAKAGIHETYLNQPVAKHWIPAFAGMTKIFAGITNL
jgi:hypothetical protein